MKELIKQIVFRISLKFLPSIKSYPLYEKIGITSLICHKDIHKYIFTIHTLFYSMNQRLPLFSIDDGSLTKLDFKILKTFLPGITISSNTEAEVEQKLKMYKSILQFRKNPKALPLKKKLDALLLHPFTKFIYLDSDILFFAMPSEIYNFIHKTTNKILYTSRDIKSHTAYPELISSEFHIQSLLQKFYNHDLDIYFNTGILCVPNTEHINLRKLDSIFRLFCEIGYTDGGQAEETAIWLMLSSSNSLCLPVNEYVNVTFLSEYKHIEENTVKSIHYSGNLGMKDVFIRDALIYLFLINTKWKNELEKRPTFYKKLNLFMKIYGKFVP